jgi:hypothetical protein
VINLISEMLNYLGAPTIKVNFKIVLLKTLRHLVAQLNFRDPALLSYNQDLKLIWENAVQPAYHYADKLLASKVFPGASSINLSRRAAAGYWDPLLDSAFNQHVLLLAVQIVKVSEESFYQDALLRLMNWLCLPQMLENRRTYDLGCRLLMEISTPELFKVQEFMHWQPKLLNHIFLLKDEERDFCTPLVAHTDSQVFNQMPHRSPGLLNSRAEGFGGPAYAKFRVSFQQTFHALFDPSLMEHQAASRTGAPERSVRFLHEQYLDLMAIYDIEYFQATAIPELLLNADKETLLGQELVLLGLGQAAKVLDPAMNFRQKYMTVHEQIAEAFQDLSYSSAQASLFEEVVGKLRNFVESALILLVQSPLFAGKVVQDTLDFCKSSQYKDLCSDSMGVIWPSPSLSLAKESEFVSKFLQRSGLADHLLEINSSAVTFEDHIEISGHHFEEQEGLDPLAKQADHP